MGLVSDAAAMARGRAGAIFLTAALALLPAYFLAGGIVFLAAAQASAQAEGGSTQADAAVAARFPALSGTAAAALALIALGLVACALPGLFVAFAFSLAGAVAVAEGISGFPALQRSWELIKRAWPQQLALILGTAALVVVLTQGLGRLLTDGAILAHGLLDAAVAAAVLPLPVFGSAVLYLRERSAAEGKPVDELRQYIRRTSEPG